MHVSGLVVVFGLVLGDVFGLRRSGFELSSKDVFEDVSSCPGRIFGDDFGGVFRETSVLGGGVLGCRFGGGLQEEMSLKMCVFADVVGCPPRFF